MHEINFFHEHELAEHDFLGCCKDCQNSLAIIKPHILGFADKIRTYSEEMLRALEPDELYRLYQLIDDLAHMDAGPHLSGLLLDEPEIRRELPLIRSYYTTFFSIHEARLARDLIRQKDPWKTLAAFPFFSRYEALVRNQIKAMPIAPDKRLLFLGSGPVPMTLILMNRIFGVRSIGIDNNPESVGLSREVLRCLGQEKDIEIIQGDDAALMELDWEVVLVAALAEPKMRIFSNIRKALIERGMEDAPVVFRTYTNMKAVLYKPVQPEDVEGFEIVNAVAPTGRVNNTTVFMHVDN